MRTDVATVDDRAGFVDADAQRFVDPLPDSATRPVGEAVVDVVPGAEALGQIAPGNAGLGAVQHGVDKLTVADIRAAAFLHRQNCCQALPLLVAE